MSGIVVSDVLARVHALAGASDTDRSTWLGERRQGVTATQVKELMQGKTTPEQVAAEKVLGDGSIGDNKYLAWGRTREPALAAYASRFGVAAESRVFKHAEVAGYLASPDGIGVDPFTGEVMLGEFKTSKHDIFPGTERYTRSGYEWQMQWQMFVLGAERTLYVLEQHNDDWQPYEGLTFPEPTPMAMRSQWVIANPDVVPLMREKADRVLELVAEYERDGLPEGIVDEIADKLAVDYLRALADEKTARVAKETAFEAVKARCEVIAGDRKKFTQTSVLARVTWSADRIETTSTPATEDVVDEAALAEAEPRLVERVAAAAARVERARVSLERAEAAAEAAAARLAKKAAAFTETQSVTKTTTATVRGGLRITVPKAKG